MSKGTGLFALAVCALSVQSVCAATIDTLQLITPAPQTFVDSTNTLYSLTATQPAGSGVFNPFVRIQRDDLEQGYNSGVDNGPSGTMDIINLPGNSSPQLPFNSTLADDRMVHLTLDYNETGSGTSTITLEELILVISTDPNKAGPAGPGHNDPWSIQSIPLSAGDIVLYQMSTATDPLGNGFVIQMDANHNLASGNGGSGTADLNVDINLSQRQDLAALLDGNHFLYVYSRFSDSHAGFEEWSSFQRDVPLGAGQVPPVPEPASLGILALGGLSLLARRRRVNG